MNIEELQKQLVALRREFEDFKRLHSHNGRDSGLINLQLPIVLDTASFLNTSVPNSGLGKFAIRHSVGTVELELSGNGEGLGSQQVLFQTVGGDDYFGLFTDSGTTTIETNIVSVGFVGTGASGGVLKNQKNSAASALSGTQRDIEIDLGGTPYYFTVYPTKA